MIYTKEEFDFLIKRFHRSVGQLKRHKRERLEEKTQNGQ